MGVRTSVDDRHGQTVSGEEQHDILPSLLRVLFKLGLDVLRKRLNQTAVVGPAVNYTPCNSTVTRLLVGLALKSVPPLPQLIQAAARCRAGVLRILCECDSTTALAVTKTVL